METKRRTRGEEEFLQLLQVVPFRGATSWVTSYPLAFSLHPSGGQNQDSTKEANTFRPRGIHGILASPQNLVVTKPRNSCTLAEENFFINPSPRRDSLPCMLLITECNRFPGGVWRLWLGITFSIKLPHYQVLLELLELSSLGKCSNQSYLYTTLLCVPMSWIVRLSGTPTCSCTSFLLNLNKQWAVFLLDKEPVYTTAAGRLLSICMQTDT